jgi:phenylacetate-coenzyme A ligase PaaK-like adenylate-forming protein
MDQLTLEFESESQQDNDRSNAADQLATQLSEKLSIQLNLRFEVLPVAKGVLPQSEGKAKRIFDRRI